MSNSDEGSFNKSLRSSNDLLRKLVVEDDLATAPFDRLSVSSSILMIVWKSKLISKDQVLTLIRV